MTTRKMTAAAWRAARRLAFFMALYAIALASVGILHAGPHWPEPPMNYALALLPALPIFGAIWALFAHINEETDEYWKHLHIRAQMLACGATLSIATALGFVNQFAGPLPFSLQIFMIYNFSLVIAMAWTFWRAR